jgi:GT2 family glycosyltransferase
MTGSGTSIVIPVHNRASLTHQCLKVLTETLSEGIEIVVVDDGSNDVTPEVLQKYESRIHVVRHRKAQGFASACNDGAAAAGGRYLLFLNNDTMPTNGWLGALVDDAESHPHAAAVGAKLLFPNDTVQHAGVAIMSDRNPRHIYMGFPGDHPAVNKSRRFQVVTAACVLMRREAFEAADGFDESFLNGFEDVDLCLRLGEMGHEIRYCHLSVLYHFEKGTRRDEHFEQNLRLYRGRWARRVRPDEFEYYVEDGLLRLEYPQQYPIKMAISPRLAVLKDDERGSAVDRLLAERSQQVFGLLRENLELKLAQTEPTTTPYETGIARRQPPRAALFVSSEPADPRRYRCDHQAEQLSMLGASVDVLRDSDVGWGDIIDRYGMFILHRVPFDEHLSWFIGQAHRKGKAVIFDTDDLVFDAEAVRHHFAGLKHLEPAERHVFEERVQTLNATMRSSDAVTAATAPLGAFAREFHDNVAVTPNTVSRQMVEQADSVLAKRRDTRTNDPVERAVTIAYLSGTPTHDRDFLEAADAVLATLKRHESVRLLVVGDLVIDPRFADVREQIREVPFQAWQRLPELLAEVDINLAPLERSNPFTESKSCIKYLEAGLLAVPTIASPRSDFRRVIEHGKTGLLADTPDQWRAALERLVSSPDLRRSLGAGAHEDVRLNHTTRARARSLHGTLAAFVRREQRASRLRFNVVSARQATRAERAIARALTRYLSSRGHTVRKVFLRSAEGHALNEVTVADASIATDAVSAELVAANGASLFGFNLIVDKRAAVPSVLQLPLRHLLFTSAADAVAEATTMLEPDWIDESGRNALRVVEAVVLETCFLRLTPALDAPELLTPTRR